MLAPSSLELLQAFRTDLYACFDRRRDALFELTDAALTAGLVPSLAHLSLAAPHRRGWGSLYAALTDGRIDAAALRALLARYPLGDGAPVYAIDSSVWPRCAAETSPERGFSDHPSRHSAGQPIVAGWSYQWLAQLSFRRDSWTAPRDVRRVHRRGNLHAVAAEQIRALVATQAAAAPPPTFVFDAGSDPEHLARAVGELPVAVLVRLRRDRCFYADPTDQPATGRPRRHGAKFVCQDPATWPPPDNDLRVEDVPYGRVRTPAGPDPRPAAPLALVARPR